MRRWLLAIWVLLKSLVRKVTEMPRRYLPDQELVIIEDDFDEMAEYGRTHQVPGTPTAPPPPKGWEALQRGKTIGKTAPIRFATGAIFSSPSADLFEVSAENGDAMELSVLLSAPKFAPALSFAAMPNIQDFRGPWQDNVDIMNMTPAQIAAAYGVNGPLLTDVKAEITWGTGGIDHRAIVDVHNGAGIIINASFVRIREFVLRESNSGSDMFYLVGAQIAPGVSKYLGAQFTQPMGEIDLNTESVVRAVPRFARRVHLAGGSNNIIPAPLFAGRIRFWRNATGPALNTQLVGEYRFTGNSTDASPVRIPNGAYFYTVISETDFAAATGRIFAIFDLAI